jgi:hypothetical protein
MRVRYQVGGPLPNGRGSETGGVETGGVEMGGVEMGGVEMGGVGMGGVDMGGVTEPRPSGSGHSVAGAGC